MYTKVTQRAAAEAAALDAARHPGVVELVEASETTVRTRLVDGLPLADIGPLAAEEVAGLAAAVATTLADLHEMGIVHGAVDDSHVLVSGDGRPVLCSLGRGGEPPDDVADLGRLVTSLLDAGASRSPARSLLSRSPRLGPMLAPPAAPALRALAAEATADDPASRPSARALATAIHDRVPTARLPKPQPAPLLPVASAPLGGAARPRLPGRALIGCAAIVLVLALGWLLIGRERPRARRPATPASAVPLAPPSSPMRVSAPARFENGVLTFEGARYALGRPGDAVVVGDWACTGRPTPVLVRPSTGEVFAFDAWPEPGREVAARSLARVDNVSDARATRDREGCDRLEVLRANAAPVRLQVAP